MDDRKDNSIENQENTPELDDLSDFSFDESGNFDDPVLPVVDDSDETLDDLEFLDENSEETSAILSGSDEYSESLDDTSDFSDVGDEIDLDLSDDELNEIIEHSDDSFLDDLTPENESSSRNGNADGALNMDEEMSDILISESNDDDEEMPDKTIEDMEMDEFSSDPMELQDDDMGTSEENVRTSMDDDDEFLFPDEFDDLHDDLMSNDDSTLEQSDDDDVEPPQEIDLESPGLDDDDDLETMSMVSDLDQEEEDEPIALDENELDNILADVDETSVISAEGVSPTEDMMLSDDEDDDLDYLQESDMDLDDEPLELLDDETTVVLEGEAPEDSTEEDVFVAYEDDSIYDAEPDDLTSISDTPRRDDSSDLSLDVEDATTSDDEAAISFDDLEDEEDEITLTPEELGNIVSDVDENKVESAEGVIPDELDVMGGSAEEDSTVVSSSIFDDDDDDEPIALSDDELENILEDVTESEVMDAEAAEPPFEYETAGDYEHDFEDSTDTEMDIPPVSPEREQLIEQTADADGLDKKDLKKMISYLDMLFDQLPDETVKQFSQSEYFDLYKKIMTDLGL